jgi:ATP-dependent RNA helicase RhlE
MSVPQESIPGDVYIEETPFEEEQDMLRQMDDQRKKDDPSFQGAFHEKKNATKIAATKARTAQATAKNNTKVSKKIAARSAQGIKKKTSKAEVVTPKAKGKVFKANTMAVGATAKRQTGNRGGR